MKDYTYNKKTYWSTWFKVLEEIEQREEQEKEDGKQIKGSI